MAVDTAGNIFIADTGNNCVRKVSPSGLISTVAGNGDPGGEGDGGRATNAQLGHPIDVVVDTAGNLFISQGGRVRKVFPNSLITTLFTHGTYPSGAAVRAPSRFSAERIALDTSGNLFVVIDLRRIIMKVSPDLRLTAVAGTGTLAPPQLFGESDPFSFVAGPVGGPLGTVARVQALAKLRDLAAAPPREAFDQDASGAPPPSKAYHDQLLSDLAYVLGVARSGRLNELKEDPKKSNNYSKVTLSGAERDSCVISDFFMSMRCVFPEERFAAQDLLEIVQGVAPDLKWVMSPNGIEFAWGLDAGGEIVIRLQPIETSDSQHHIRLEIVESRK